MSTLSAFTSQLQNLISNLCELYPSDPDLEFTKTSIGMLKRNNPRKLQQLFSTYVSSYENEILNKKESFFIEKDFVKDDLELSESNEVDYAQSIMMNLKKYWGSMDTESKDNVWKYLQVLVILNKKCSE